MLSEVLLSRECEEVVQVPGLKIAKQKQSGRHANAMRLQTVEAEFCEPGGVGKVGEAFNKFSTAPRNTILGSLCLY